MPMQHVDGRQTDAFRSPFLSPFSFETRINTFKLHAEAAYWLYQSYDNKLWSVAFVDSHQVFVLSLSVCVTSQCQICVTMLICVVAKPSTIAFYNISHAMWAEYISNKTNKFWHQNFEYFQVVCFRCSNWHWRWWSKLMTCGAASPPFVHRIYSKIAYLIYMSFAAAI